MIIAQDVQDVSGCPRATLSMNTASVHVVNTDDAVQDAQERPSNKRNVCDDGVNLSKKIQFLGKVDFYHPG